MSVLRRSFMNTVCFDDEKVDGLFIKNIHLNAPWFFTETFRKFPCHSALELVIRVSYFGKKNKIKRTQQTARQFLLHKL